MIDRAGQFVQRNIRHGLQLNNRQTARAQEVDEFPYDAVREAITNACCHRDYLDRSPIQLKIYNDRLVIGNPGGLLPGLDVAHLEGKHKARNPLLAEWLQTQGYVERFGIGITRMREAMNQVGLPAPLFVNRPDWFEVTLLGPGASFLRDESAGGAASAAEWPAAARSALRVGSPWYVQPWSVG